MARRLRRRLRELEEIAVEAQTAAARSAADADKERSLAQEREQALRAQSERENLTLRQSFDDALERAGVVLFQQSLHGEDSFYVSTSMRAILGWSPPSFLKPGVFRGLVHPDDRRAFDKFFSSPTSDGDGGDSQPPEHRSLDLRSHRYQPPQLQSSQPQPSPPQSSQPQSPTAIDLRAHGHPIGSQSTDASLLDASLSDIDRLAEPARAEVLIRFRAADGRWVRLAVRPDDSGNTQIQGRAAGALITVEQALSGIKVSEWFTKLVENDPAGCLILEFMDSSDPFSLVIRATNNASRKLFNLDPELDLNLRLEEVLSGSAAQLVRSAVFDVHHTGEAITAERLAFAEIPGLHLDMRVMRLDDGAVGVTFKDVTSVVAIEARLRKHASHDALTGLPARSLLEERLDVVASKASQAAPVAVLLVDIVGLSEINESFGLNHGDDLLKQVGDRLVRELRGLSVVARFGDDEFALITSPCCSFPEAITLAENVAAQLAHPFDIRGHLVDVKFSIGMAVAPEHGHDSRALLRNASAALKDAKGSDGEVVVYHDAGETDSIRRLAVLSELREGLEKNQLELRFQPQLDLRTGKVRKVEAIPHWSASSDRTRMSVELLELAEQSALIQPLTRWLLTEAARASRELRRTKRSIFAATEPIVVSVNLSSRNLFDPELETFVELMARSGELEPGQLELEVNEPGLMDDPSASQEILERLSVQGVNFVVDQFGTGYTSLATMRHLAVRGLKIDRSYLASIASVASDAAVIRSTIELSHELGLFAAATGVTDVDVLAMLVEFGCDFAQGPFLSEPVTLAELPVRIAEIEDIARAWLGAEIRV